jgi:DNA-binding transcriptional regulator YiaG
MGDPLVTKWDSERVAKLREHLSLTQALFAERLNVRQQTVSEWECGKMTPRGASAKLLDMTAKEADFVG